MSRGDAPEGQDFYVYHSWRRDRAVVHRGGCRYCRSGAGVQAPAVRANDEWLGPFAREAAFDKARALRTFEVTACRVCAP